MNPLTFLPAKEIPVAAIPSPGEPARELPTALRDDTVTVLVFLRHTGCPFAEETMVSLRQAARQAPDVQWVAVSHAPDQATRRWCEAVGGCDGVEVVADPTRQTYAAWGLGRTSLGHFLGRRSLRAVMELSRRGIRNRHPHGTRWQSAGAFALDRERIVRWTHVPEHAGDLPDIQAALRRIT